MLQDQVVAGPEAQLLAVGQLDVRRERPDAVVGAVAAAQGARHVGQRAGVLVGTVVADEDERGVLVGRAAAVAVDGEGQVRGAGDRTDAADRHPGRAVVDLDLGVGGVPDEAAGRDRGQRALGRVVLVGQAQRDGRAADLDVAVGRQRGQRVGVDVRPGVRRRAEGVAAVGVRDQVLVDLDAARLRDVETVSGRSSVGAQREGAAAHAAGHDERAAAGVDLLAVADLDAVVGVQQAHLEGERVEDRVVRRAAGQQRRDPAVARLVEHQAGERAVDVDGAVAGRLRAPSRRDGRDLAGAVVGGDLADVLPVGERRLDPHADVVVVGGRGARVQVDLHVGHAGLVADVRDGDHERGRVAHHVAGARLVGGLIPLGGVARVLGRGRAAVHEDDVVVDLHDGAVHGGGGAVHRDVAGHDEVAGDGRVLAGHADAHRAVVVEDREVVVGRALQVQGAVAARVELADLRLVEAPDVAGDAVVDRDALRLVRARVPILERETRAE